MPRTYNVTSRGEGATAQLRQNYDDVGPTRRPAQRRTPTCTTGENGTIMGKEQGSRRRNGEIERASARARSCVSAPSGADEDVVGHPVGRLGIDLASDGEPAKGRILEV